MAAPSVAPPPPYAGLPRLAGWCSPVPAAAPLVCRVCHGPTGPGYGICWSCALVGRRLGQLTPPPVVPVSLFRPGSRLHAALVAYKSSDDPAIRSALSAALAELVGWFLSTHGRCLAAVAGGGWDVVDVVPSTRRSAPLHPLAEALGASPVLSTRYRALLRRGSAPLGHLEPSQTGFVAGRAARGARVLLLDDVFTTGARSRSAAASLQRAGAVVVAIVPIGRIVHAAEAGREGWWADHVCVSSTAPAPGGGQRCCIERRVATAAAASRAAGW